MNTRRRTWLGMLVSTIGLLAACAAPGGDGGQSGSVKAAQPTIELLGFLKCPSTPAMRGNLRVALLSIDRSWAYAYIDQEQLPEGDVRRGWPAPTVLVNGRDLFGMAPPMQPTMGCRLYEGGLPGVNEITGRIKAVATTAATSAAR